MASTAKPASCSRRAALANDATHRTATWSSRVLSTLAVANAWSAEIALRASASAACGRFAGVHCRAGSPTMSLRASTPPPSAKARDSSAVTQCAANSGLAPAVETAMSRSAGGAASSAEAARPATQRTAKSRRPPLRPMAAVVRASRATQRAKTSRASARATSASTQRTARSLRMTSVRRAIRPSAWTACGRAEAALAALAPATKQETHRAARAGCRSRTAAATSPSDSTA
mmetsp:Transcript_107994/g.300282  ORF Transcript_107994/g.300282 Transcript_107994/m.300282 type:complete len:231 (-) Transcript_107994:582-1274(-)